MKGIGHFLTGIAVASCFPEAMRAVIDENSLLLLLGGAFGLLPDTLDFRFGRYMWKHHHTVTPDLNNLDARPVARAVADAIEEAAATGKPVHLKLNTLKVSANYHRTYSVNIDEERKTVTAAIGPLMTMGQVMGGVGQLPDSLPDVPKEQLVCEIPFKTDVVNSYHKDTRVAIFSGPDFAFVPDRGRVRVDFIPWHRTWAHSPFLGLAFGLLGLLVYGLWGLSKGADAGAFVSARALTVFGIITLSFWGHTLVDQIGVLGSVLLWPFSNRRSSGFGWSHAASVLGNITLNAVCVAVILWNCVVFTDEAHVVLPWAAGMSGGYGDPAFYLVSLANYLTYYLAIPLALFYGAVALYNRFIPPVTFPEDQPDQEGLDGPGELGAD